MKKALLILCLFSFSINSYSQGLGNFLGNVISAISGNSGVGNLVGQGLTVIGGMMKQSQQDDRQQDMQQQMAAQRQKQIEEQNRIRAAQEAAFNQELNNMRLKQQELDLKQKELDNVILREKQRSYTAEDWFDESKAARSNAEKYELLNKALAKNPDYLPAVEARGIMLYTNSTTSTDALFDFNHASELKTRNAEIYYSRAEIYYVANDYANAASDYSTAFQMNGSYKTKENFEKLSFCYYTLKQYDNCILGYNAILAIDPTDTKVLTSRAKVKFMAGKYAEAKLDFNQLISKDDNNKEFYYYRGFCKLNTGDPVGAGSDLSTAIRIDFKYAQAYYLRGYVRFVNKDYAGAKDDFTQSIWYSKDNPLFYYYRANSNYSLGALDKAAQDAEDAIGINPTFEDALRVFAESESAQMSGNASLKPWFNNVLEKKVPFNNCYYHLATFYSLKNEKSKSLDWLDKAIKVGTYDLTSIQNDPLLANVKTERRFQFLLGN